MRIQFLLQTVLIAVFCSAVLRLPAQHTDDLTYIKNYEVRFLGNEDNVLRFEVTNHNPLPPSEEQARAILNCAIAVPPQSDVSSVIVEAEWKVYWQKGDTEGPFELDDSSSAGPLPSALSRPNSVSVGVFRSVGLAQMNYSVTSIVNRGAPDYERGTIVIERAIIEATISGQRLDEEPFPPNLQDRDPYLVAFSKQLVLNSDMVTTFTRALPAQDDMAPVIAWDKTLKDGAAQAPVLLSRVTHPGIHRISPRGLLNQNVEPSKFRASGIRVFAGNQMLPLVSEKISAGPFVGESSLTFYVPDTFPRGTEYVPVWMMQLPDSYEAAEIEAVSAPPEQVGSFEGFSLSTELFIFEPRDYNKKFPTAQRTGQWASRTVARGKFEKIYFDVEGLNTATTGTIAISYAGLANAEKHLAQLYVNGVATGQQETMTGLGPFLRSYELPGGLLHEGRNVITVHFPDSAEERIAGEVALASARVTYPVDPRNAPVNRHLVLSGEPGKIAQIQFQRSIEAISSPRYLFDVSDPIGVRKLATSLSRIGGGIQVNANIEVAQGPRRLYYADGLSIQNFSRLETVQPTELLNPAEGADYIIIAHPTLIHGIQEYAEMRRQQKLKVAIISSESIMQTFNFGAKDYRPIHTFLRYAFDSWPGQRLSKVLIVGEASEYPWEYIHVNDKVTPNLVPAYGFSDPTVPIHSDDSYAQLSGNDSLPDLEIGRFSVQTAEQASRIARRIWDYENNPQPGPWRTRHLFITDDEPDFERVAERIISSELSQNAQPVRLYLQEHPYEDYFRIFRRKRSTAMTEAIVNALSDGALTACYLGHGGPNLWSGERIFHYRDIPLLKTEGRRPIMTAASCDTAWIDYPVDPVRQSLGEHFLLDDNGGGISVFAPIAGTSSYEHDFILRPFYEALNNNMYPDLGGIIMHARMRYLLNRGQTYVSNQFILLGDPALRIPRPSNRIELQIAPKDFFVNQAAPLSVEGSTPSIQWGLAELEILDLAGITIAGPERATILTGKFSSRIPLPKFLVPGKYRLVVHAYNKGENKYETIEHPITVNAPDVDIRWTMEPAADTEITAGQTVVLKLSVSNNSPGYMDNVILSIRNAKSDTSLTSSPLVLNPGQTSGWEFRIPSPPGINIIEAVADYANKEPGQQPIARGVVEFRANHPSLTLVSVPEKMVEVQRIAAPEGTDFKIPLYNISGKLLHDVRANLYLLDRPGGSVVGTESTAPQLDPRGKAMIVFSAKTRFPEGNLPFKLEVTGLDNATGEEVSQVLEPLLIAIPRGNDIVIVPGSVQTERKDYVRGHTVYVRAAIKNEGKTPAEDIRATLYVDYPWDNNAIAPSLTNESEKTFDRPLMPGESRDVRLRWDPSAESNLNVRLYVVANADRKTVESDYTNNVGDVAVSLLRLPNLALDRSRIRLSQNYVRPGDVVGITIPYKNNSPFDFGHYFVTEVRARGPELTEELIYRGTFDKLDAGEEGLIQTSWRADGRRDTIYISLNDDRDYGEQDNADNVASLEVTYVLNNKFVQQDLYTWSFATTFQYGDRRSLYVAPDNSLILTELPVVTSSITFSNEYVVGQQLPMEERLRTDDNRMSIIGGAVLWSPYETPEPVKFRVPMPKDDETTLYDIHFVQLPPVGADGMPRNQFRYLIEDEEQWRSSQSRESMTRVGRIETRDDFLDVTIAPDNIPSWNTINSVNVAAIQGDFTSAVYEVDRMPEGTFDAEVVTPPGTNVVYNIRVGSGDVHEPRFSDWMRISPGDGLPAGDHIKLFQFRTSLVGNEDGLPELKNIHFHLTKPADIVMSVK